MKKLLAILILICACLYPTQTTAQHLPLEGIKNNIVKFERLLRLKYKLNDITIAAIIGNSLHETGGTLDYKEKQKDSTGKDMKGVFVPFGLFQFTGQQNIDYKKFLGNQKDSFNKQVDFFMRVVITNQVDIMGNVKEKVFWPPHDIGWANRKKLRIIFEYPENVEEVTRALVKYYFRPGKPYIKRRIRLAHYVYELLQNRHIKETFIYKSGCTQ